MKEIQLFKDEKWVSFGEMKDPRYYHDVSVIESSGVFMWLMKKATRREGYKLSKL